MCYSIAQLKKREFDFAVREGLTKEVIDKLFQEWQNLELAENNSDEKPMYRVSGFEHPLLFTVTKDTVYRASKIQWGLIPSWTKDPEQASKIMDQTLNARGETIFEKPSFKDSATNRRCLIFVDGFYEHHHHEGKTYPFFIQHANQKQPLILAGLWSEWIDRSTGEIIKSASIVTTKGNELMKKIHNNPKLDGARMPLILNPESSDTWLTSKSKKEIEQLIIPFDEEKLNAYTVGKFSGKNAVPDGPDSTKEKVYEELLGEQDLFS